MTDQYSDWLEYQRQIAPLLMRQNHEAAKERLEAFLAQSLDKQIRSEALMLRGSIYEDIGRLKEAERDYQESMDLSGDHLRHYACLISLGSIHEQCGEYTIAMQDYMRAMQVAVDDGTISCGVALYAVVGLCRGEAPAEILQRAIQQSWGLLGMSGPVPDDFKTAVDMIISQEGKRNSI